MGTPAQPITEKPFDPKAYLEQRNSGSKPEPEQPKAEEPAKVETKTAEPEQPHVSRSQRREMNRLREEAAELRGRLKAFEEFGVTPKKAAASDDEPNRNDFDTDAKYAAAVGKWSARQEARTVNAQSEYESAIKKELDEAQKTRDQTRSAIEKWDEIVEGAEDLDVSDKPNLKFLFATSDMGLMLMEHFVNNPDDWDNIIALESSDPKSPKVPAQRKMFHRLEGKMEILYAERQKKLAAQAKKEKTSEDRNDPADGEKPGRTATSDSKDARLPKPTSEVGARGGTAPPSEPKPGTPAWMAKRNELQQRSRY